LQKLRIWLGQIRERDYFSDGQAAAVDALLGGCEEALNEFMEAASRLESSR
jgi:hypothetical protein